MPSEPTPFHSEGDVDTATPEAGPTTARAPSRAIEAATPGNETDASLTDITQETDVWWGAYAGRTMAPTFALCALLSLNISLVVGWLWDEEHLSAQLMWHAAVVMIIAVWFFPLVLWIYRTVSRNYRLTTRKLYRDSGFRHPADGQVTLARVTRVWVKYSAIDRWLGVGRVVLDEEGGENLVLDGVYDPEPVAALIRRWVERARKQC